MTVRSCWALAAVDPAIPYLCTQRCMRSSISLAYLRRSRSSLKAASTEVWSSKQNRGLKQHEQKGANNTHDPQASGCNSPKYQSRKKNRRTRNNTYFPTLTGGTNGKKDKSTQSAIRTMSGKKNKRNWDNRRRDPRVNGADIYVVRVTKSGKGSAMPCWRCLEWARWAGIKRIFYWNEGLQSFEVVKVSSTDGVGYETRADSHLYAAQRT